MSKSLHPLLFFCLLFTSLTSHANGILRNGLGARSISLGGAGVAFSDDPLNAMNFNPATLSEWKFNELQAGLTLGILDGEYTNSVSTGNEAETRPGFIPEIAYVHSINNNLSIGLSVSPVSALEADWHFLDPPGTLGSYGQQTNKSLFVAVRSALGLGIEINPHFSVGVSAGLTYNRNRLQAPYIFQTAPGLAGSKILVNLETDGFGLNGVASINYKPTENSELSLSYTTPTTFETNGTLRGTSNPVIGLGSFSYDAEVETALPQVFSGGFTWQTSNNHKLGIQLDWIDWSNAFDELPLDLTNESAGFAIPVIHDVAPLDWKDQIVLRLGGEYQYSDKLQLRAGYSFGDSPVPSETLTPTGAAIMRHTIGLGLGYQWGDYNFNLAYQWDLPTEDKVGTSRILFNEFNNSEVDVSVHWLSISVSLINPFTR